MLALLYACSFLLGSLPFGIWVSRNSGVDIRAMGSGNLGATNVARSLGATKGAIVLVLDVLKGVAPGIAFPFVVQAVGTGFDDSGFPHRLAVGAAAAIGHMFSPWLGFRGGKGVATGIGAVAVYDPILAAIALAGFIIAFVATRIVSASSIAGSLALVVAVAVSGRGVWEIALVSSLAALVVGRHSANIRRLSRGQESKFQVRRR